MSQPRICPECHCAFHQDFVCTTCGAEKLRDESMRVIQDELTSVTKQRDAQLAELEAISRALWTNEGHSSVYHIEQLVKQRDELLEAVKTAREEYLNLYDNGENDCVTPYDHFFYGEK
jgi:RNA polymerase subunit RPABC4/transcription elongation factor Spt4